jgi:alanine-glyoxylate transaminase/serine-glyoxylate transaminase/serine-pyruvate transaminase
LLQNFNLEIGAGLGSLAGKVWRIGLMGYASNAKNVILCLSALESVLSASNAPINKGVAIAEAYRVFS